MVPTRQVKHTSGTVGDHGPRPGRITAAARPYKLARGTLHLWGATQVPVSVSIAREDERAVGRKAGGGVSARGSASTDADHRARAAGVGRGDATGTCARL